MLELCGNYLDENCGGDCESFKFAIGNCGCQSSIDSSGCTGKICLVGTSDTDDCLCNPQSFDIHSITVVPYSSGASGGGIVQLDRNGKAGVTVDTCGTYQWLFKSPPNPYVPFCYTENSGLFTYEYRGSPGSCQQIVPITIIGQNGWCDTSWTSNGDPNGIIETSEADGDGYVKLSINPQICVGSSDPDDFVAATAATSRTFCTFCDRCEYILNVTVCQNEINSPILTYHLPGSYSSEINLPQVESGPLSSCEVICETTVITGIVSRGPNTFSFTFDRDAVDATPEGNYVEVNIQWNGCSNRENTCRCGILEDDSLHGEWNDECFGTHINDRNVELTYNEENCTWESDCFVTYSGRPCSKFVLLCRDHCCIPPTGFPFHPQLLLEDSHDVYLYEFYKNNCVNCDDYLSWDYYIWKKTRTCNPLEFKRAWKKCDGAVSEASLGCEHSFLVYTACSGGWVPEIGSCDNCDIHMTIHGLENHLPLLGRYSLYKDGGKIIDGEITSDSIGFVSLSLPSGDSPWMFVYEGDECYSAVSGEVACDELLELYAPTGPDCIVHSGECTLCEGAAFKKILYLTDNFGEDTLSWNDLTFRWEGSNLDLFCYNNGWSMQGNLSGCYPVEFYVTSGNFTWDCEPLDIRVFANIPSGTCIQSGVFRYQGSITE